MASMFIVYKGGGFTTTPFEGDAQLMAAAHAITQSMIECNSSNIAHIKTGHGEAIIRTSEIMSIFYEYDANMVKMVAIGEELERTRRLAATPTSKN